MIVSSLAWSKDISFDDLVERDGLYYEKFSDVPFTGNVVSRIQGRIIKGKQDGIWLIFDQDGKLSSKSNFRKGIADGQQFLYLHENGDLSATFTYKQGQLYGEYISYFKNGQIKSKANYKEGKREGEYIKYFFNGHIAQKYTFINGIIEGMYYEYYDNGELRTKGNISNDLREGVWETYNMNGEFNDKITYKSGDIR